MPAVTVVIPVYNGSRFLRSTLESVFEQTCQDYEIICVDDGSTDASLTILAEYADRVRVINQVNAGQGSARNAGVRRGTGKYIAFLDQDDRWYPQNLERQVAELELHPDLAMVHCDMDWIDTSGQVIRCNVVSKTRRSQQDSLVTFTRMVGWDPAIYPSTMLIRRDAFDRIDGFDPDLRYGEDIDLALRLKQDGEFLFLAQSLTQYRKHSANFSGSGSDTMFLSSEKFLHKLQTVYAGDRTKEMVLNRFFAQLYSDWGKMKIRCGCRREGQRLLLRSLRYYPWKVGTYSRIVRSALPSQANHNRRIHGEEGHS